MKELSVEEKAQRYDEALERARYWEKNPTVWSSDDICQKLFPELKESEDEKIRQFLIHEVTETSDKIMSYLNMNKKDILAWLEKQQKSAKNIVEIWKDMRLEVYQQASGNRHEPNYSDDTTKMFSLNDIDEIVEKMSEQSPTDKVEPKFQQGQWIVWKDKCYKVNSNGCGYELIDQNGLSTSLEYGTIDEDAHLWDITKDAKDGDVLACPNDAGDRDVVFIFKNINSDEGWVFCYCAIDANGCFCTNNDYVGNSNSTNISPATKEQRDALEKAMADAGWEFDFEKKELKKIVVPKFNVHDCVIKKHNSNINDFGSFVITDISGGKYWYNDRIICDIAEQDEWEIYEPVRQKPAWSEEDTQYINDTLALLSFGCSTHSVGEVKEWLQSLNNRVQPKQEWSEEDKRNLNDAILFIKTGTYSLDKDNLINWLKSLSPQKHWKPSDEQIKILNEVLNFAANHESPHWNDYIFGTLNNLIRQLKKL